MQAGNEMVTHSFIFHVDEGTYISLGCAGKEAEASRVVSQALIFGCLAGSVATVVITVAGPWLLAACGANVQQKQSYP